MDYLVTTSMDVPEILTARLETPSPHNPLGAKGVGEGGTIGGLAAVIGAIQDALQPPGPSVEEIPLTPEPLWRLIRSRPHKST